MNKIGPIRATRSKQQAQLKLFLKPLARFASLFIDLQVLCPGGALIGVYIFVPLLPLLIFDPLLVIS